MPDQKITDLPLKATPAAGCLIELVDPTNTADDPAGSSVRADVATLPIPTATATALAGKAASVHTHAIADTAGLQTALDGKQAAGSYATAAQGTKADSAVQTIALATPNLLFATPIAFAVASGAASGTLALNAQAANTVLAGPTTGAAAAPTLRALVVADLPTHTHATSQITDLATWPGSAALTTLGTIATGTWHGSPIAVAYLGTGTPGAGKYLDGAGSWTTLPAAAPTTDAALLTSGTLGDARLSANVPLKNAASTFTAAQTASSFLVTPIVPTSAGDAAGIFPRNSTTNFDEPVWYVGRSGTTNGMGIQSNGLCRFDAGITAGSNLMALGGSNAPNGLYNGFQGTGFELDITFDAEIGDNIGWARFETTSHANLQTGEARTSTNVLQVIEETRQSWADPTHATRKGRVRRRIRDATAARTYLTVESDGTQALIGVYAAAPVARAAAIATPTDLASALVAITALRDAIKAFGITL